MCTDYGDLVYKLKNIVGSNNFSEHFIKIFSHYKMQSPYLCVISLLYLDLYVLGEGALVS